MIIFFLGGYSFNKHLDVLDIFLGFFYIFLELRMCRGYFNNFHFCFYLYWAKFLGPSSPIHLVGLNHRTQPRSVNLIHLTPSSLRELDPLLPPSLATWCRCRRQHQRQRRSCW